MPPSPPAAVPDENASVTEALRLSQSQATEEVFDIWLEAGRTEKHYWRDLWCYRELFAILAWRDVAIRYKQTVAGAAWTLLQPFLTMVIMTMIFGRLAGLPSDGGAPYAILVFAALLPWQFFSNSVSSAGQSLVGNAQLISKVYFPRMIIPASSIVVSLVDFLVTFAILGGVMAWYRFAPNWQLLCLPLFIVIAFFAALGPGLILTALNVRYRDVRFILPFLVQFGLYVSPVAYSSAIIRDKFGDTACLLYFLNPMAGVIDGFRWCILGSKFSFYLPGFALSMLVTLISLIAGVWYFRKTERSFADVI